MDIIRAKEIIAALAEGIDPITGELLPDDSVCNNVEVVRAFYAILKEDTQKSMKNLPDNAGKPWSAEDDEILKNMFISGVQKSDLQRHFARTRGSIEARLKRLGLIE